MFKGSAVDGISRPIVSLPFGTLRSTPSQAGTGRSCPSPQMDFRLSSSVRFFQKYVPWGCFGLFTIYISCENACYVMEYV